MLVISRKERESIVIENIDITVIEIKGSQVRIGINAPKEVAVVREELLDENGLRSCLRALPRQIHRI